MEAGVESSMPHSFGLLLRNLNSVTIMGIYSKIIRFPQCSNLI